MKNSLTTLLLSTCVSACISTASFADTSDSPTGVWVTIDDKTGQPTSYVEITQNGDSWNGHILRILEEQDRNAVCTACKGDKKNQPVEGMEILWGLQKTKSGYDNGKILDPDNGKTYSASMKLKDDGKKLEVRGYIGFSLIGRSQTWKRL